MNSQTVDLIGILCTVLGAAVTTIIEIEIKDVRSDVSDTSVIRIKLDNNFNVGKIYKNDIKAQEMRVTGLLVRVIRVENLVNKPTKIR